MAKMRPKPSPVEHLMFDFIRNYIVRYGYPPSMREIAIETSVSVSVVSYRLKALEENGLLLRTLLKSRAIRITSRGKAYPRYGQPIKEGQ